MAARELLFRDDARERIRRGVDTLAEAVKSRWARAAARSSSQNAGFIASLILSIDCLVADVSKKEGAATASGVALGAQPDMY
jgi:chaperonin GroEL (HSP60 family)